jgi:hypothetical protein
MIATQRVARRRVPAWHVRFLAMLPRIQQCAQVAFRDFDPEAQEDAIAEVVANCLVAYVRLVELNKEDIAYPTVLASFAIRQYREGRRVGNKANSRDVCSAQARQKGGYKVHHIGDPHEQGRSWVEQLAENRQTSPAELACFRLDFKAWLETLSPRNRQVVEDLAAGNKACDVAASHGVSEGRISQLRRQLGCSWEEFVGDEPGGEGVAAAS